jgi:cyclophilin family peptidyl-prolyl cis-trans isomerase
MFIRIVFVVLLSIFSSVAWAASPPTQKASESAASAVAPAAGPKAQEFAKLSKEFNELLADMTEMQSKYAAAGNADTKAEIAKKFNAEREKAHTMAEQLITAAENAYTEAPNADKDVTDVLVGTLIDQVDRDDYEPAFKLGKMLMDNKCPNPAVPALAGIAAFCVNEYDLAEPWLKAADASGDLAKVCDKIKQLDHSESPRYYLSYPQTVVQAKEEWAKEKKIREAEAKADDLPRVLLKTSKGDIVIELFEDQAPNSVLNFISLVQRGYYDGLKFHRVLPGFMAQGGDPKGTGSGGPGYTIPCECYRPDYRLHYRGTLSMAHAGRDTGGSQFFLTFLPTPHLNGKHTAFGRVINTADTDSFAVLAKLKRIDPETSNGAAADKIIEAKVLRKRAHSYDAKDLKKSSEHD